MAPLPEADPRILDPFPMLRRRTLVFLTTVLTAAAGACTQPLEAAITPPPSATAITDSLDWATSLEDSIRSAIGAGELTRAGTLARQQLAFLRRRAPAVDGPSSLRLARTLTYLSLIERNLEDFDAAEAHAREVLNLTRTYMGPEHGTTASAWNHLAGVLKERGRLLDAEAAYRKALDLSRSVYRPHHPRVAAAENNLGTLLLEQGDWVGAAEQFRAALEIVLENRESAPRPAFLADLNLARALVAIARPTTLREARQRLDQGMEIWASISPPDSVALADLLAMRARVHEAEGDLPAAAALFAEAIGLRSRQRGPRQIEILRWRLEHARVLRREGDLEAAVAELRRAHELAGPLVGDEHPLAIDGAASLAAVELERGRTAVAIEILEPASRAYDRARRRWGRRWRRATTPVQSPWPILAATRLRQNDPEGAWTALQHAQARWLDDLLTSSATGSASASKPDFPTFEAITAALDEDEAILGWLDEGHDRWAYVLRRGRSLRWVALSPGEPEAEHDWRTMVVETGARAFGPDAAADLALRERSAQLFHLWVEPAMEELDGIEHLIVVPDGALHGVALEALAPLAGPPLLDRFAVRYAPSARYVHGLRSTAPPREGDPLVLAVGDPPYRDAHRQAMLEEVGATPPSSPSTPRPRSVRSPDARRLPRLPSTREEVVDLRRLFPTARVLLGPRASEEELHALARATSPPSLRDFDLVHLATHAWIDPWRPEDSRLFLAQPTGDGDPEEMDDGILTAAEIMGQWRLGARLVTLSACSSALGRRVPGEGYLGFAHAFFHAGASSLVLSLWEVDDEATALLMHAFYQRVRAGDRFSDALRAAKRTLRQRRDARGERPYHHPWFWSGFVLLGADGVI